MKLLAFNLREQEVLMDIKLLVSEFINNSPDFYEDDNLLNLDKKHFDIINQAYKEIDKFDLTNLRNWSAQSDLACPASFSFEKGLLRGIIRPLYKKLFFSKDETFLLQAFYDDIDVLRLVEADNLLRDNPVSKTPAASEYFTIDKNTVNLRWLRYIYLSKKILDMNILKSGAVWVDIGSFYGGLQGIIRKYCPDTRIVMIDFHHQLCRSYIYHSLSFPNSVHILPSQIKRYSSFEELPEGSITYIPVSYFGDVSNWSADLVTNFFSFGEMSRDTFFSYFSSKLFSKAKIAYTVNRFVSSPFFEKTYDNDLTVMDYYNSARRIDYFDVFPIHHYMLIKRKLFNRNAYRNISSPYFEMISKKV